MAASTTAAITPVAARRRFAEIEDFLVTFRANTKP
jgi:hypothetical protein